MSDNPPPESTPRTVGSPVSPTVSSSVNTAVSPTVRSSASPDAASARKTPLFYGWRLLLVALLVVLLLVFFALRWWQGQLLPLATQPGAAEVAFTVQPGWGATQIAHELQEKRLIKNANAFELYLRLEQLDRELGEGNYLLSPGLSVPELAARLAQGGKPATVSVLIPEGFSASQVQARMARQLGKDIGPLIANPGVLRPPYAAAKAGLEGYLFPAKYEFDLNSTPEEIVQKMLSRFDRELTPAIRRQLKARKLSVQRWVNLASIVQAEAGSYQEMPIIAGVFLNRLDVGMALQSDPTVAYGLHKKLAQLNPAAGDLQKDTPWNSYTRAGLPRTPIGNPGKEALASILRPQRNNADGAAYLYFFHTPDGGFIPNLTFEDHNRDVRAYLQ